MIPVTQLCKRRKIIPLDILTPILIPSFSSKGFLKPKISWIWNNLKNYLNDAVLVSSYDIYYEHIDSEFDVTNMVVLDSGGYEKNMDYDLSENREYDCKSLVWVREKHKAAVSKIKTLSPLILVSYDNRNNIFTQVEEAKSFFSEFEGVTTNFLIKPTHSDALIDIESLLTNVHLLTNFDILGITEKELGDSFVKRLQNLVRLRQELSKSGSEIPIHIFGSLDPISSWFFYLCGADLFDGLSWLRFAFYNNVPIYFSTWAVFSRHATEPDEKLKLAAWVQNLDALNKQRLLMARFPDEYDLAQLPIKVEEIQKTLNQAGVTLDKGGV